MKHMLLSVERAKVEICRKITRWSLDADLSSIPSFPIDVPSEPFSSEAAWHRYLLSAPELRDFFVNQVWRSRLKGPTSEAIKRAQHELRGRPIDVVLFSGGSSNIRWLRTLMESDFSATFDETRVIDLQHDFQEVVAKGLAIECARRFYTRGEGDFNGVAYNFLHLMLGANNYVDPEIPRFRPATDDLKHIRLDDGVLIPSASSLRPFMERGLQWRTSLRSAPSRHLDYFFLRSSFNHCDVNALQNIQERRVYTPPGTKFGAGFDVKLFVKEDGTAFPQFIYGKGKQENATTVDGRPFYLDMTTVSKKMNIDCYIGFDFGTSNSSACFVSREHIESRRSVRSPKTWLALSDAEPELPYPVSRSVAEYLAEPTQAKGRAAVEQALSFATFVAYAEYRSLTPRQRTKLFSVLARRSAGPLWHCLKQLLDAFGDRAKWCSALARFQEPAANDLIENTVNAIASEKHEGPKVDINQCLELLVNKIVVMMQGRYFGVFENVHKRRLRKAFEGYFRCLHGRRGPFITVGDNQGNEPISNECVFLWDSRLGEALELSPLYLYGLNTAFGRDFEEPEMFFYDACRDQRVTFRAIGGGDPLVFSRDKEEEFMKKVIELFDGDNEKSTLECVNVIFESDY